MQKCAHLGELEKCCQTHIFLQNFVLIQPRTSPPKVCKNLQNLPILLTLTPAAQVDAAGAGSPEAIVRVAAARADVRRSLAQDNKVAFNELYGEDADFDLSWLGSITFRDFQRVCGSFGDLFVYLS